MSLNMFNTLTEMSSQIPTNWNRLILDKTFFGSTGLVRLYDIRGFKDQTIFLEGRFDRFPVVEDWPFNIDIFANRYMPFVGTLKTQIFNGDYSNLFSSGSGRNHFKLQTLEIFLWIQGNSVQSGSYYPDYAASTPVTHSWFNTQDNTNLDADLVSFGRTNFKWSRSSVPTTHRANEANLSNVSAWVLENDAHNRVLPAFPHHGVNANSIVLESQLGSKFWIEKWKSGYSVLIRSMGRNVNSKNEGGILELSGYSEVTGSLVIDSRSYAGRTLKWTDDSYTLEAGKYFRIIFDYSYPLVLQVTGVNF